MMPGCRREARCWLRRGAPGLGAGSEDGRPGDGAPSARGEARGAPPPRSQRRSRLAGESGEGRNREARAAQIGSVRVTGRLQRRKEAETTRCAAPGLIGISAPYKDRRTDTSACRVHGPDQMRSVPGVKLRSVHPGRQRSFRLATLSTRDSAYQGSPFAPIVIPTGSGRFFLLKSTGLVASVITPSGVIRAMLPRRFWVNHTLPSSAAAMPNGAAFTAVGNSASWWGPDVLGVSRAMRSAKISVAHTVPSGAIAILLPSPLRAVVLTTPTAGSSSPISLDPVNHTVPSAATARSSTSAAG